MRQLAGVLALLWAGAAWAQDASMTAAGHSITVVDGADGAKLLAVDGQVIHSNGLILIDAAALEVGGVTVVTGVAGPGGNACNAAPFVLALAEGAAPELYGPIDSCAALTMVDVQPEAIVFAAEPMPSEPGEVWVWNRMTGITEALPVEFAPTEGSGWDQLESLAGAHPAEALALAPVYETLVTGLGPDYAAFAERLSDLGSGELTADGYLGEACLKFTCEADFAVLYLHRETRQAYAIWRVMGEIENHIYPQDTTLWPAEAMAVLREKAGP